MSETKVENVKDFLDKLIEIQKSKSDNTELFFRGHADRAYEAEPTIFRKNGNGERNLLKNEKHLFNDMITQCPEDFKDCQYTFEYLVKMQHYGLPTRLLDITSNALVALYFACYSNRSDEFSKDGKVFIYAVRKDAIKNYNSDTVSVLANLAKLDGNFKLFTIACDTNPDTYDKPLIQIKAELKILEVLQGLLKRSYTTPLHNMCIIQQKKVKDILQQTLSEFGLLHYYEEVKETQQNDKQKDIDIDIDIEILKPELDHFTYLQSLKKQKERFLHFIKQEKSYFIDKIDTEDHVRKVTCVRAKLNNQRIIRQNGLFFLFGMGETKADTIKFSDYIKFEYTESIQEEREPTITEITNPTIIISAEKKNDILKELRNLGISKETLMPEIDTVAGTLKDRYN